MTAATMEEWHAVTETLPMTCRCSDEGRADADKVWADFLAGLAELGWEEEPRNLLSAVVLTLEHDFGGWFVDFAAMDMWYGAAISKYDVVDSKAVPGKRLTTQGDTVEDCLALLWLRARELHREDVPPAREPGLNLGTGL